MDGSAGRELKQAMANEKVPQSNRKRWAAWIPWVVALAALGYLAGLTLWLAFRGLVFPYQLDYGEGLLLHFVNEWAHGRPIYGPIGQYPFVTANYPPLSMALALALTPTLGVTYAAGRIWTLLAIAALATLLVAWVQRAGERWLPALAAALFFVGSPYIYHWAPLFRVDLVGLALSLGGLTLVGLAFPPTKTGRPVKARLLWVAVLLFVAGLYAKQSFLFAPLAAGAYLLIRSGWKQAYKLASGMLLLGGGLFLAIQIGTRGGLWQGLVVSNVNPFLWPEFGQQVSDFVQTFGVLFLLAGWYLLDKYGRDRRLPLRDKLDPLDLYLPAALVSVILAGKAGAWENYFFEALAALCLGAGVGLSRLARHGKTARLWVAPALILLQVALMWHTPRSAQQYLALTERSNQAIEPVLAQLPDRILSEDMGLLVTNGKTMDYCSFQYSQLARAGRWDQSWELGQLRARRLSAVILETGTRLDVDRYQRFTREFLSELDRNYALRHTLGKYEVYEPAPLLHERRADWGDLLSLVGWTLDAPSGIQPGDSVSLTVVWQAQKAIDQDYVAFAHWVDQGGQGWAGDDHQPYDGLYPTSAWGAGEMVRDRFDLEIPADAPPGLYDLQVGWYHPESLERLAVGGGDSLRIAVIPLDWKEPPPQDLAPVGARFGEAITLEGYALRQAADQLELLLRWLPTGPIDTDYTVFVHVVDSHDKANRLAQDDAPPKGGRWPTSMWLEGVALNDLHRIWLPADRAPGDYTLYVGLYDPITGARMHLPEGQDALRLATLTLP